MRMAVSMTMRISINLCVNKTLNTIYIQFQKFSVKTLKVFYSCKYTISQIFCENKSIFFIQSKSVKTKKFFWISFQSKAKAISWIFREHKIWTFYIHKVISRIFFENKMIFFIQSESVKTKKFLRISFQSKAKAISWIFREHKIWTLNIRKVISRIFQEIDLKGFCTMLNSYI